MKNVAADLAYDVSDVLADSDLPILLSKLDSHLHVGQSLLVGVGVGVLRQAFSDDELLQCSSVGGTMFNVILPSDAALLNGKTYWPDLIWLPISVR